MDKVVYSDKYELLDYGPNHPLQPERFRNTQAIIKERFPQIPFKKPEDYSSELLRKAHTNEYIERVKEAGKTGKALSMDTPAFPKIFDWGLATVQGSLTGGELILGGDTHVALNPCGGWHHAGKNSDGGFCVFNDVAILAKFMAEKGWRPLIIDIDGHAGNGTARILRKEPILKVSIHQDPSMFYPREGFIDQVGKGDGFGYTVNLPLPAGSDDGCLLYAFDNLIMDLLDKYDEDVILFQAGVDGHIQDPLTNLRYTSIGYLKVAERLKETGKPVVMMGGGGYQEKISPKLHVGIFLRLIGEEERALELMKKVGDRSKILTDESCLDMTREIVNNVKNRHPFFKGK